MDFEKLSNEPTHNLSMDDNTKQATFDAVLKDNKYGITIKKFDDTYEIYRHEAKIKSYKDFAKTLEYIISIIQGEEKLPEYDDIPDKIDEVVDMAKQNFRGTNWDRIRKLWYKLVQENKAYPTDAEGIVEFGKFYNKFIEKNKREPSLVDAVKFIDSFPSTMIK